MSISKDLRDFYYDVVYDNRFASTHPFLSHIERLQEHFIGTVTPEQNLYRARLCTREMVFNHEYAISKEDANLYLEKANQIGYCYKFDGYDAINSMAPPFMDAQDGRANPRYISYLYAAFDPHTALCEVRPAIGSCVSIATLFLRRSLKVFDIVKNGFYPDEGEVTELIRPLMGLFSASVSNELISYIPSQVTSEYIKRLGFDAIVYPSSQQLSGRNCVIFDPSCCSVLFSVVERIQNISYTSFLAPSNPDKKAVTQLGEVSLSAPQISEGNLKSPEFEAVTI